MYSTVMYQGESFALGLRTNDFTSAQNTWMSDKHSTTHLITASASQTEAEQSVLVSKHKA